MSESRHVDGPAGWSLERWLPVFIFVVLACVVAGLGAATYREVRGAALMRATSLLERGGRQLAFSFSRTLVARTQALRTIAEDSAVVRDLVDRTAPSAAAERRLADIRTAADSTVIGWLVTTPDGEPRFSSRDQWSAADSAMLARTLAAAARDGSDQHSVLYDVGRQVHTWTAAPIRSGGRVVGVVAELRRRGDFAAADAAVRGLLDEDARMLFTSQGSDDWVSLRGVRVPAPFASTSTDSNVVRVKLNGHSAFAVHSSVATTPWFVVVFQPEASMLQRPHEFRRRYIVIGIVVLVLAALGAWQLSRVVTRPLRVVTRAAAALGRGDYTRRVGVIGGGRELMTLSATFDTMAGAIDKAHAELEQRNAELEKANAELEKANAAKSQFLAMMSHELRTPLNAIGGFTEILEVGVHGTVTPKQVEDLARIRHNKDLLLSIINDMLQFTRGEAGQLVVEAKPVQLGPLLVEVSDAVGAQLRERNLRLTVGEVPADAVPNGDRAKVQQVLLNLVSNAVKFSDAGDAIDVATSTTDGEVRVAVRDTGPGIEPSKLELIFEPFTQVDSSLTRRAAGTGMGLAIARKLATAMGGTVTVESELGVGSTFTLTLPRAVAQTPAKAPPVAEQPGERQTA